MERETYDEYSSTLENTRLPVYRCRKNKAIFIATRRPLFFQPSVTKLEKRETIMRILEKNRDNFRYFIVAYSKKRKRKENALTTSNLSKKQHRKKR